MVGPNVAPLKCFGFVLLRHTVQKIKANVPDCGVKNLVDFIPGDVLETRRGGVDVLRTLAQELATLERHGSIKIIRNIPEVGQRIGHLLVYDGTLAAAFHDADTTRFGIEALLEIETDASALDAQMSLHEMSESSYITAVSQHPTASLIAREDEKRDEAWWAAVKAPRRRLGREERLPEVKPSVSVPEALRRRSEARLRNQGGPVLQQGQAWLENSIEADHIFNLGRVLIECSRPVLVISRQAPPRISSTYNIDLEHYRWLSETPHERTLEPSLEAIRREVDQFLTEHQKSILIVEGIEYLSGIHGELRVIEMVRSIVDQTRSGGNILLVSSNLEAFTTVQRSRLEREFSRLGSEQIQTWLLDIELFQEHPFFVDLDEEIEASIKAHLEANVRNPILSPRQEIYSQVEQVPLPVEHQTIPVDEELQSKMRTWANDSDEEEPVTDEVQEEEFIPEESVEVQVKPRTPQRVVRRRKHVNRPKKKTSIDAAAQRRIELPNLNEKDMNRTKPFVPHAPTRDHAFPESKTELSKTGIGQAATSASGRKVAKFPPIKPTGHVAILHPKSKQPELDIEPSIHAREQSSTRQRTSEDES